MPDPDPSPDPTPEPVPTPDPAPTPDPKSELTAPTVPLLKRFVAKERAATKAAERLRVTRSASSMTSRPLRSPRRRS